MKLNAGINFTVFVLFFGMALLEAFRAGHWWKAGLWVAAALLFLAADNLRSTAGKKRTGNLDEIMRDPLT